MAVGSASLAFEGAAGTGNVRSGLTQARIKGVVAEDKARAAVGRASTLGERGEAGFFTGDTPDLNRLTARNTTYADQFAQHEAAMLGAVATTMWLLRKRTPEPEPDIEAAL